MSLTVKRLNLDASFLLTFEPEKSPLLAGSLEVGTPQAGRPFRILLDPWLTGNAFIGHWAFCPTSRKVPPYVSSLRELPNPDLVLISDHYSNHCHEATLRQLVAHSEEENRNSSGNLHARPLILAPQRAADVIRGWGCFDADQVRVLDPWKEKEEWMESEIFDDYARASNGCIFRLSIDPAEGQGVSGSGAAPGEVTVAYVTDTDDKLHLHGALAITYRPPCPVVAAAGPTPDVSTGDDAVKTEAKPEPETRNQQPALSVVFTPNGTTFNRILTFAADHFVLENALPLTAMLCNFNTIDLEPTFKNIVLGAAPSFLTAAWLGVGTFIVVNDGNAHLRGLASWVRRVQHYRASVIYRAILSTKRYFRPEEAAAACGLGGNTFGFEYPRLLTQKSGQDLVLDSKVVVVGDEDAWSFLGVLHNYASRLSF